jgi:hypothetical protein
MTIPDYLAIELLLMMPFAAARWFAQRLIFRPPLAQSGHFDAGSTSNSITAGFRFIVAREIIHLRLEGE